MIEDAIREAIITELERQAADRPEKLTVSRSETRLAIDGAINLDELVMAVVGSLAGGP